MCFRQKADWDVDQERIQFYDRATHPPGESDFSDFSEAPKISKMLGLKIFQGFLLTWHENNVAFPPSLHHIPPGVWKIWKFSMPHFSDRGQYTTNPNNALV